MKLSFKTILPILLIFTLLILFAGCFITPSPGYIPPTYTVTYNGNTNTSGVAPTDANLYEEGVSVMVLANSGSLVKTGYTFNSWNTAADGSGTSQATGSSFNMGTANVTLYAQWTANPTYTPPTYTPSTYTVTTAVDPASSGTVTGAGTYNAGTVVTITANQAIGWTFISWTGDLGGNTNPTSITMNSNKNVTATFTQDQYTLTVTIVGSGTVTLDPTEGTYLSGTSVALTAVPATGWSFKGWTVELVSTNNPENIIMNSNKNVTATFTQDQYTLVVNTVGSGSVTKSSDKATYLSGTVVTLDPEAADGWTFAGWSGDLSGSTDPADITMNSNKSVTATFTQDQYTLTVTVVGNGTVTLDPVGGTYASGTSVKLTAVPATGWSFKGWTVELVSTNNPENITMNSNKSVTATFTQDQYTLTVTVVGNGTVTLDSVGGTYASGTSVKLTAVADAGWTFTGWSGANSGDLVGTDPATITMNSNKNVTATFTQDQYTLTVNTVGSGSVTKSSDQATYLSGTVVTLDPQATAGWTFAGWSGDLSGSADPANITMNSNKSVTATFVPAYTLTVTIVGNGTVTLDPIGGTYASGTSVKLTAVADAGWVFKDWSGNLSGTTSPKNITMNSNKSVTANFETCALTIVAGSGKVTITSNYGDVVTGNTVATFTSGGTTWGNLGNKLQARVTTTFPTHMTRLVLTPTATTNVVTITGREQTGENISPTTLTVEVRDKIDNTITKSFTVDVSGNVSGTTLIIGTITVLP